MPRSRASRGPERVTATFASREASCASRDRRGRRGLRRRPVGSWLCTLAPRDGAKGPDRVGGLRNYLGGGSWRAPVKSSDGGSFGNIRSTRWSCSRESCSAPVVAPRRRSRDRGRRAATVGAAARQPPCARSSEPSRLVELWSWCPRRPLHWATFVENGTCARARRGSDRLDFNRGRLPRSRRLTVPPSCMGLELVRPRGLA